jgi:hypothetical protein
MRRSSVGLMEEKKLITGFEVGSRFASKARGSM